MTSHGEPQKKIEKCILANKMLTRDALFSYLSQKFEIKFIKVGCWVSIILLKIYGLVVLTLIYWNLCANWLKPTKMYLFYLVPCYGYLPLRESLTEKRASIKKSGGEGKGDKNRWR